MKRKKHMHRPGNIKMCVSAEIATYKATRRSSLSGRELEADVLTHSAMKLKACQALVDTCGLKQEDKEAVKHNQRLWTVLQAEIAYPDDPLTKKLKEDLLD